ncbi:hypothetical protein B0H14DRAFT_3504909 [Mycena olivaceomarginata]|nr:hypothetical protein B0H14DRAFT_3504909 [Mycena olivaceomarginata]
MPQNTNTRVAPSVYSSGTLCACAAPAHCVHAPHLHTVRMHRTRTPSAAQCPCVRRQASAALHLGSTAPTSAPAPRTNGPGLPCTHAHTHLAPAAPHPSYPSQRGPLRLLPTPIVNGPGLLCTHMVPITSIASAAGFVPTSLRREDVHKEQRGGHGVQHVLVRKGVHTQRGEGVTLPRARTPSVAQCCL